MTTEKVSLQPVPLSSFMMHVNQAEITLVVAANNAVMEGKGFKLEPEWKASYAISIAVAQQLIQALTDAVKGWEKLADATAPKAKKLQSEEVKAPTVGGSSAPSA